MAAVHSGSCRTMAIEVNRLYPFGSHHPNTLFCEWDKSLLAKADDDAHIDADGLIRGNCELLRSRPQALG
jgi:hypothetical protein